MTETREHPINQPIIGIEISAGEAWSGYNVGRNGVTRIEATTKSGMYADIPYVRVWKGEVALAEFCQHNIVGITFGPPAPPQGGEDD